MTIFTSILAVACCVLTYAVFKLLLVCDELKSSQKTSETMYDNASSQRDAAVANEISLVERCRQQQQTIRTQGERIESLESKLEVIHRASEANPTKQPQETRTWTANPKPGLAHEGPFFTS